MIIKKGNILIDDKSLSYEVIEVLNDCVIVLPIGRCNNLSCEIITKKTIREESWIISNIKTENYTKHLVGGGGGGAV